MATELAKAYVQIIPSAKGISETLKKEVGAPASSVGQAAGDSIVGNIKKAIVAAGIGTLLVKGITEALNAGGDLQQSFGGLDTIYEDASEAAKKYAYEAQQAGISANSYAEQAVSFGASLKQAFGGDTTAAVEAANTAILDMADNSAKMGTDIESIQNAYQGFAKQNYTMLDNLKLGYGGTKEEMQRLLADAQELSGVEYNIDNLGDVYAAIHVIQEDLGLTGVAAYEAGQTFTGSFNAMKAAAENLMADLALGNDISVSMQQLGQSMSDFLLNNLLPMLGNIIMAVPDLIVGMFDTILPMMMQGGNDTVANMVSGVMESIPDLLDSAAEMMDDFISYIEKDLPELLQKGVEFVSNIVNGILQNLPQIITSAGNLMAKFVEAIIKLLPTVLKAGVDLVLNLVKGIVDNFPEIIKSAQDAMTNIFNTIAENYPTMIEKGIELIGKLVSGIVDSIPDVVAGVGDIINNAKEAFFSVDWLSVGSDIVNGVISGISSAGGALFDSLKGLASDALSAAKKKLDINSPSKVFANEVGKWIPAGIAEGISDNTKSLTKAITDISDIDAYNIDAIGNSHAYGTALSAQTTSGNTINMTIYGAQGQDVNELANIISRKINASVGRKGAVWA